MTENLYIIDANKVFSFTSKEAEDLYGGVLAPQTEKSAGIDLIATSVKVVEDQDGNVAYIIVGTGVKLNPGFDEPDLRVEVHPRSSLFKKTGLIMVNSTGIVDNDYKGEILVQLAPLNGVLILPVVGERVAQATLVHTRPWSSKGAKKREGGFGSTGSN